MSAQQQTYRSYYIVSDKRRSRKDIIRYGVVTNGRIQNGVVQYKVQWDDSKHEWVNAEDIEEDTENYN